MPEALATVATLAPRPAAPAPRVQARLAPSPRRSHEIGMRARLDGILAARAPSSEVIAAHGGAPVAPAHGAADTVQPDAPGAHGDAP